MEKVMRVITAYVLYVCSTMIMDGAEFSEGNPPEWLPTNGMTTSGVDAEGRSIYYLPYFGEFVIDQNHENRIIQLGPIGAFTWVYHEDEKSVTLNSDWWGPLHTSALGSGSDIGVTFPDVISELQGGAGNRAFYRFDVHNKDVVFGKSIFDYRRKIWTSAIGAAKYDAERFYKAAEGAFIQLQNLTQNLKTIKNNLTVTQVGADSQSEVNEFLYKAKEKEELLLRFKNYYSHYHNRLLDSQNWLRAAGASSDRVKALQQNWILGGNGGTERSTLAQLQTKVLATFNQGMSAFDQFVAVYDSKNAQIQSAQNQPTGGSGSENPSSGSGAVDPGQGGVVIKPPAPNAFVVHGDDHYAPAGAFNVSNDAISWDDVIFTGKSGQGYERSLVSTWPVDVDLHSVSIFMAPDFAKPWLDEWMIEGDIDPRGQTWGGAWWILVPYNGKFYAAPYEGFDLSSLRYYGMGNLNWPTDDPGDYDTQTRVLRGSSLDKDNTAVWGTEWGTPKSGVEYGFFLSADIDERKGRHRSNIVKIVFPE